MSNTVAQPQSRAARMLNAQDVQQYFHEYNEMFRELYAKLRDAVKEDMNEASSFVTFVKEAMMLVGVDAKELHGVQKKELTIDLVKKLVDDMTVDDDMKQSMKRFIVPMLSDMVDLSVTAYKGYLFLKSEVMAEVSDACAKCQAMCVKSKKCNHIVAAPKQKAKAKDVPAPVSADTVSADVMSVSNEVYDKLKSMIHNKAIDMSNIMSIMSMCMQLLRQYSSLQGSDKKAVVMTVMNKLMDKIPMDDAMRATLKGVMDSVLSKGIDFIFALANGQINLKEEITKEVNTCKAMFGCMKATPEGQ
jgi:hypothetical protein